MEFINLDKEYTVDGSGNANQQPKTEMYFLNVPFGEDYKHVIDFNNAKERFDAFVQLSDKHVVGGNIIRKDTNIVIDGILGDMEKYNYIMYRNASVSSKWWFAFIRKVTYQADHITTVEIKTDVWQSYLFERKFYKSYVIRTHIPKTMDTIGRWVEPEPVYAELETSRNVDTVLASLDWEPQWVLHTTSKYNKDTGKYEYKGNGLAGTYSGEYGKYVNSPDTMQAALEAYGRKSMDDICSGADWKSILNSLLSGGTSTQSVGALTSATSVAELQDHRDECIGLFAIPRWAITPGEANPSNDFVYKSDTLNLARESLANGYVPRNKKLLSSVFTSYVIYNRNGFKVVLKPESLGNSLQITIGCSPMGTTGFILSLDNYDDKTNNYFKVPYSCQQRIGYDKNTGLDKAISAISSVLGIVGGVSAIKGGDASGAVGALEGTKNLIDSTKTNIQSIGASGDITSVTDGRATIRVAELSPSYAHSIMADEYLDQYGYAVNEVMPLPYYMTCRSNWNYIKTQNINLSIIGNNADCEELKGIFDAGVTIWHGLDNYGDYTKENN